jgi:hypothetical protein
VWRICPDVNEALAQLAQLGAKIPSRFVAAVLEHQRLERPELLAVTCSDDQRVLTVCIGTDSFRASLCDARFSRSIAASRPPRRMCSDDFSAKALICLDPPPDSAQVGLGSRGRSKNRVCARGALHSGRTGPARHIAGAPKSPLRRAASTPNRYSPHRRPDQPWRPRCPADLAALPIDQRQRRRPEIEMHVPGRAKAPKAKLRARRSGPRGYGSKPAALTSSAARRSRSAASPGWCRRA